MAMTEQEAERFYNRGRDILTTLAQATDEFRSYARSFESRGGAAGMPSNGQTTEGFVVLQNELRAFLDADDGYRQRLLDQYRHDI